MKEEIVNEIVAIRNRVQGFVQDLSKPLDERWDLFCAVGMGSHSSYYVDFKALDEFHGKISWYDDYYLERYSTMKMDRLVRCFREKNPPEELIVQLKEEILEKFIWSFENDW